MSEAPLASSDLEVRLTDAGRREAESRLRSSARGTVVKASVGAVLFAAVGVYFAAASSGDATLTVGVAAAWTGGLASIALVALKLPAVLRPGQLRTLLMTVTPTTVVFHEQARVDGWGPRNAVMPKKVYPLSQVTIDINSRTGYLVLSCPGELLKRRLDTGLTDQPAWTIYAALTRSQATDAAQ